MTPETQSDAVFRPLTDFFFFFFLYQSKKKKNHLQFCHDREAHEERSQSLRAKKWEEVIREAEKIRVSESETQEKIQVQLQEPFEEEEVEIKVMLKWLIIIIIFTPWCNFLDRNNI